MGCIFVRFMLRPALHCQICLVGGGLAGTAIAAWAQHAGLDVVWVDAPPAEGTSASQVAAGLVNIVTGVRPALTWHAHPLVHDLMAWLALPTVAHATAKHLHRMSIYRRLATHTLYNDWCGVASHQPQNAQAVLHPLADPWRPELLGHHPAGLRLDGLGWVDVPQLLVSVQQALQAAGVQMIEGRVDWTASQSDAAQVVLADGRVIGYHHLLCAEGIAVNHNPLWPYRKLQPLKGQILTVRLHPDPQLDQIVTGGLYLLPTGQGTYHVGSTYEHMFDTPLPTQAGRDGLVAELQAQLPGWAGEVEVLAHRAGIRATTPDRRAVLARHPAHSNVWFLNGLGTKGLLQAPFAARLLVDAIVSGVPAWPAELDGGRKAMRLVL